MRRVYSHHAVFLLGLWGVRMKPFEREKAAQYFIVGWVKNWQIKTYLSALGVHAMKYEEIHDLYPWLPDEKNKHYYFKNISIQAWCARAMKEINDKLWDTDNNAKRLSLAKRIEHWDSTGVHELSRHVKDASEHTRDMRENRQASLAHKVSVATMRRGNGYHWGVVK